ncbi:MAG: chromosomal replication initiator protein DnaA [Planctomycetota bacterium]
MTKTSALWDDILAHVRLSQPELVRGWFADLNLGEVDGGVMNVHTRNAAQSRYLQAHCRLAFVEAGQAATGRLVSVDFIPDQDDDHDEPTNLFGNFEEQISLNPEYTFDNFVTGPCNRLAHAAAVAVSEDPGRAYNPLFIYGPVGLGKTHLLQAVCHAVSDREAKPQYHYISCETFVNQFIACVERGALTQFRYRYRHVDVLVIDDIQFLAERERSQEEFFHTFNTLYQGQRQIILSADCSPTEIPSLEERLVSRFNSGLVALVDRPCTETRMAILRKKAKLRCIEVPEDVIRFVAGKCDSSIRELEGVLVRLDALSQTLNKPISLDLASEALGVPSERSVPIPAILEVVSKRFSVKISDLLGKKRSKTVTHPRHVSMYLARQLTAQSLEEIGGYFGGRDHTTVLHANRTISRAAEDDPKIAELLENIAREVRGVI